MRLVFISVAVHIGMETKLKLSGYYKIICRRPNGSIRWVDEIKNIVTNEGLDNVLDVYLSAGTQDTTWFVLLTDGSPTVAATDTLASHAGWSENANYSGNRKAFTEAGVSSQQITNSASPASFAMNTNSDTVGGCGLASVDTGTTGVLFSVGAFTGGDKSVDSGDTLEVTYTLTASDN